MARSNRALFRVIVHTFVFDDEGRLLLLRRANTGFLDGHYTLPGGHVERGEEVMHAATREVCEEVGLDVLEVHPRAVMPFERGVDFLFEATRWCGSASILEPENCDDLVWTLPSALPDPTVPFVEKALELRDAGIWYHEFH
jgi:8-oxo-dGTP diphosphatase